jgi:hypothetical protein
MSQIIADPGPDAPAPEAPPQRDAKGRFAKGNKGGTGNPFARQIASFRAALVNTATDEDFEAIAHVLLLKAKSGDLAAIKLFLSYTIGKPAEAPDPDRLELEDFQLLQARLSALEEDWHLIRRMVPVEGLTEAGHRVADLRAACWREEVLGAAAEHEPRSSATSAARPAGAAEQDEEQQEAAPDPVTSAYVAGVSETAALVTDLLRSLRGETETTLAALKGGGAPPSANGGTVVGAPSANGETVIQAPSANGCPGRHPPSANGGTVAGAPSANGGNGRVGPGAGGVLG